MVWGFIIGIVAAFLLLLSFLAGFGFAVWHTANKP